MAAGGHGGVGLASGDHPAEVGDQPPGWSASAGPALDPAEPDAAPAVREVRGSYAGGEPDGRDGQAGVAGKRGQPGQLAIKLGVAAAAGQAYQDDQTLASRGVTAEQMIGVPPHPAQPPDRYALSVQGGPDHIPELAGERARAAVHVFEYRPSVSGGRIGAGGGLEQGGDAMTGRDPSIRSKLEGP